MIDSIEMLGVLGALYLYPVVSIEKRLTKLTVLIEKHLEDSK